jgi:hypothetical protein
LNQVPASAEPYAAKFARAPYPYLLGINYQINGAGHNYHGAFVKAERRFKKGLYYQAHLTLAKSMGDDWTGSEDAFNRERDSAQGGSIPRWRGVMLALYDLPFGRGQQFGSSLPAALNHLIGNWSIGGTYVAQTGLFFTPGFSGVDPSNTNIRSGRPDRVADGNLSPDERTLQRWFDTAAFVIPPSGIGRFGNSGAYVLEGPGVSVFHFGANKEFVLHERARLKLEMVSTNFLNHPNFANPSATVGTSAFGQILATSGGSSTSSGEGPRDFSFTVRLIF